MSESDPLLQGQAFLPRLPEDRTIITASDAARLALSRPGLTTLVGAEGSGPALVAQALSAQAARQIVYLAANQEAAQLAAGDLAALGKGLPLAHLPKSRLAAPLVFAPSESTPYAEVHGDRRATMLRTAALCELLAAPERGPLVVTAGALVRRVPPRQALREATLTIRVEQELDVVALSQRLTSAGYLRAPVVEDPGSYALRGGIVDLWWRRSRFSTPTTSARKTPSSAWSRRPRATPSSPPRPRRVPAKCCAACVTPSISRPPKRAH